MAKDLTNFVPIGGPGSSAVAYQVDPKQLLEVTLLLERFPTGLPTVLSRAINKTAVWSRKRISDAIREIRPGIKAANVREAIRLFKARASYLAATNRVSGRRIAVSKLGSVRQTRTGVAYKAATGERRTIPHAFLATMASGHQGAFRRTGILREMTRGRYKGKIRESIQELFGPSIPQVAGDLLSTKPETITAINDRLASEISRQVDVFLQQNAASAGAAE